MAAMLVEVLRAPPDDHRYVGKGLTPRFVAVGLPATLLIPAAWATRRATGSGEPYPTWMDNLFLSVFALDMAGNVLDLYDGYRHFDLIPHGHGGGAATVLIAWAFGQPMTTAIKASSVGHVLLEAQELGGDLAFGTRNVRGWWDVAGDLGAGIVGSLVYAAAYQALVRDRGREPAPLVG
jgi:hypothetical protein